MEMPVVYISLRSMFKAFERAGIPEANLCTYCIGGKYPFADYATGLPVGASAQLDLLQVEGS